MATEEGGGAATISGANPALENPASLEELATFLEATNRPYNNAPGLGSDLYVGDWSGLGGTPGTPSDTTGDGSINTPFATIAKALQLIGYSNPSNVNINLANAAFPLPALLAAVNNVTIKGNVVAGAAYTIVAGGVVQADEELIDIKCSGTPQSGADTFRGELYEWEGAAAVDGFRGWIRKSADGGGTDTDFKLSQNKNSLGVPIVGDKIRRQSLPSILRISGATRFVACTGLVISGCILDDGSPSGGHKFGVDASAVKFVDTRIDVEWFEAGAGSHVVFDNALLAAVGDGTNGHLLADSGSVVSILRGSNIDVGLRGGANDFVVFGPGSTVLGGGNVGWTDLGFIGIAADGCTFGGDFPSGAYQGGAHDVWSFLDCDVAMKLGSFTSGAVCRGATMNLQGEVSGAHAVVSHDDGSVIFVGTPGFAANAIRTSSGGGTLNAVSTDGGVSARAISSTGTKILQMAPDEGTGLAIGGPFVWENPITPPALAADADDYAPTGLSTANTIRVSASGSPRSITGLLAPNPVRGQLVVIINVGTLNVVLENNDAGSVAANRFLLNGAITLAGEETVLLGYSPDDSRWRALSDF